LGVNVADGEEWLDHVRLASLLGWAARLDSIETGTAPDTDLARRLMAAAEAAGYQVDRLRRELSESGPKPPKGPTRPKPTRRP
jgi:hypothetical protein